MVVFAEADAVVHKGDDSSFDREDVNASCRVKHILDLRLISRPKEKSSPA